MDGCLSTLIVTNHNWEEDLCREGWIDVKMEHGYSDYLNNNYIYHCMLHFNGL